MPVDQAADGASTSWNNSEESGSARLVPRRWAQNTVLAGPGSGGGPDGSDWKGDWRVVGGWKQGRLGAALGKRC